MNKASAKTFLKTFNTFTVLKDMVRKAVDPEKPTLIKTHPKNREKLDDLFLDLGQAQKNFFLPRSWPAKQRGGEGKKIKMKKNKNSHPSVK